MLTSCSRTQLDDGDTSALRIATSQAKMGKDRRQTAGVQHHCFLRHHDDASALTSCPWLVHGSSGVLVICPAAAAESCTFQYAPRSYRAVQSACTRGSTACARLMARKSGLYWSLFLVLYRDISRQQSSPVSSRAPRTTTTTILFEDRMCE